MASYLLVVANTGTPTTDEAGVKTRLEGQGHTVTYIGHGTTPSFTGIGGVVMGFSAIHNTVAGKYDSAPCGVLSLTSACRPHSGYVGVPAAGAASQSIAIQVAGDPLAAGLTGTQGILTAAGGLWQYNLNTNFTGAQTLVGTYGGTSTRVILSKAEAGVAMNTGNAPTRRALFALQTGMGTFANLNANGLAIVDAAVTWTLAAVNAVPTANAGADQFVEYATTVTLNGTGSSDPEGAVTYAWTQLSGAAVTLSNASASQPTFTAPSVFGGDTLVFQLTVTDNGTPGLTATDTVAISVSSPAYASYRGSGAWTLKGLKGRRSAAWH